MADSRPNFRGVDLIGDIHGCAKTLVVLLEKLGYEQRNGVWQHASRQAVFLGDIVDRGPRIREALHIVRDMVEHGAARIVMGNHEYNALCYCTPEPSGTAYSYLREHTPRHERLIRETLEQFENHPQEWQEFLTWFTTLPLFIEEPEYRVVHACWDEDLIREFAHDHPTHCIDETFLLASVDRDSFAGQTMDRLLRGTDLRLPDGEVIVGRDGFTRRFFRTKFWSDAPQTMGDVVFQPDPLPPAIAARPLADKDRGQLRFYPITERPVFVGHYWMSGRPAPLRSNIACLDYSAVKYGKLVAYRFDGEAVLQADKFVWVDVFRPEFEMDH